MSLKSLFFKEAQEVEEPKPKSQEGFSENPRDVKPKTFGVDMGNSKTIVTPVGNSTTDYNKVFDDVIAATTVESPGFKEFSKALDKLNGRPFTDQQKYENTFMAFETMGLTPEKLVRTGEKLAQALESQRGDFEAQIAEAERNEVLAKQAESAKLQKENEDLTKKIQDNATKIQQLNNEAIQTSQDLNAEKVAFENTLQTRTGIINQQISNINLYLNGTNK